MLKRAWRRFWKQRETTALALRLIDHVETNINYDATAGYAIISRPGDNIAIHVTRPQLGDGNWARIIDAIRERTLDEARVAFNAKLEAIEEADREVTKEETQLH